MCAEQRVTVGTMRCCSANTMLKDGQTRTEHARVASGINTSGRALAELDLDRSQVLAHEVGRMVGAFPGLTVPWPTCQSTALLGSAMRRTGDAKYRRKATRSDGGSQRHARRGGLPGTYALCSCLLLTDLLCGGHWVQHSCSSLRRRQLRSRSQRESGPVAKERNLLMSGHLLLSPLYGS